MLCNSPQTYNEQDGIRSPPAVVKFQEGFDVTPGTLDGISVIPGVRIDEAYRVIYGAVRVTVRPDILICSPAITDERSARFDPSRICPEREQEMF